LRTRTGAEDMEDIFVQTVTGGKNP
jgi:hypothetical protein